MNGLVHISQLADEFVANCEDHVKEGDTVSALFSFEGMLKDSAKLKKYGFSWVVSVLSQHVFTDGES